MSAERSAINYTWKYSALIMLLLVMTGLFAQADVFSRWGASKNMNRLITNMGGKATYSADININGQRGRISIFGFADTGRSWVRSMHSVAVQNANTLTTLLALQLTEKALLFKIERPVSNNLIPEHYLQSIPPFPQSTPAFYAHDEKSDLAVSVSKSNASPADVRAFYRNVMTSDGWLLTTQATENSPEGMSAYIKKDKFACVAADRVKFTGETRITLVYKKLGIK